MTTTNHTTNNINNAQLINIKKQLSAIVDKAFEKRLDRYSVVARYVAEWFIDSEDNERVLNAVNKLKNQKDVHGASNAFRYRFKFPKEFIDGLYVKGHLYKAVYMVEYAKLSLGAMVVTALGELGYLGSELKQSFHKDVTGKVHKTLVPWYNFAEYKEPMFDPDTGLPKGLSLVPDTCTMTKLNVKSWETPVKFNRRMKDHCKYKSSVPMQVIPRTREEWTAALMEAKSFASILERAENDTEHQYEEKECIMLRIEELVDGLMRVQEHDRLYIQYGLQPSTRDLCLLAIEGLALHGAWKYSWQFADERTITQEDVDAAIRVSSKMYSKSVGKPRINTKTAMTLFENQQDEILSWLLSGYKDLNEKLYFEGLHQIITNGVGGKTKRMIFEDLASNGPGIFGTSFGLKKFALMSNLTSSVVVHDGHQAIADAIGINDREAIKQIASNRLFHGGTSKVVAKQLGIPLAELNADIAKVYGEEFQYMNFIAQHIGSTISNTVTSHRMISPDGFIGINQSYAEQTKFKLTYLSLRTRTVVSIDMVADMPLLFVNGKVKMVFLDGGSEKKLGGFANPIHMLDATMKRRVERFWRLLDIHGVDIHDNFGTSGVGLRAARSAVRSQHCFYLRHNSFLKLINYMGTNAGAPILELPQGDLNKNEILKATEFMQP